MAERHRGNGRPTDRERGPSRGSRWGGERDRGDRTQRGGRADRSRDQWGDRGREQEFRRPAGSSPPVLRERASGTPPALAANEEYEEVDASLAVALLEAATKLTELVGTSGLPEGYVERREAVIESFEAIYFALMETVMGEDEAGHGGRPGKAGQAGRA